MSWLVCEPDTAWGRAGTQGNRSACVASGTAELWTDSRPGHVGSQAQGVGLSPELGWAGMGRATDGEQLCALDFIPKTKKKLLLSG